MMLDDIRAALGNEVDLSEIDRAEDFGHLIMIGNLFLHVLAW